MKKDPMSPWERMFLVILWAGTYFAINSQLSKFESYFGEYLTSVSLCTTGLFMAIIVWNGFRAIFKWEPVPHKYKTEPLVIAATFKIKGLEGKIETLLIVPSTTMAIEPTDEDYRVIIGEQATKFLLNQISYEFKKETKE